MSGVYANGMEISSKSASGKSICAFPDVCMSPPSPPAGPIPLPYPNTAMASDMTDGSKSVKISDDEVMLKDQSNFKKSSGDEAATKAWGMGMVTHQIQGKAFFVAWSMDVKFEGQNVPRHLDLTTHNHASNPPDTPPIVYADRMSLLIASGDCQDELDAIETECGENGEKAICPSTKGVDATKAAHKEWKEVRDNAEGLGDAEVMEMAEAEMATATAAQHEAMVQYSAAINEDDCQKALQCALVSYDKGQGKDAGCCPPQTPEHLVSASSFGAGRGKGNNRYIAGKAPCTCAEGHASKATHGFLGGARRKWRAAQDPPIGSTWTLDQAAQCGADTHQEVYPHCSAECVKSQLLLGHKNAAKKGEKPYEPTETIGVVDNEGVLDDTMEMEAELMLPPSPRG